MPITIREARASQADRDWIEETYGEYLADLTADTTGVFPRSPSPARASTKSSRAGSTTTAAPPFMVLREQEPVGFAVVQRSLSGSEDPKRHYRLSEFFIRQAIPQQGRRARRRDADLRALRRRMDRRRAVAQSRRDPLLAARRCPNSRTASSASSAARARSRTSSRAQGRRTRWGADDAQSFRTTTWTFRGPATSNSSSSSNFCPSTSGFFSPISITCMPFGANSIVWPGVHVQHRDLAHARDAVLDLGAVNLDLRGDRRRELQQPVGLARVVLRA